MKMEEYIENKFSIGGDRFLPLRKLHEDGKISTEELSDIITYYESALYMKYWEGFFTSLQAFGDDHEKTKTVVDIFTKHPLFVTIKSLIKNINP